ncbi:MAG: putative polysaccharide biosynthesis protein [Bacillota bacterium]|jgi:stage V sporulation protein B|nr:polysaccharide biosynthesis protein [Candidatus Fermentithermobacillaceae bacterium]
MNGKDSKFLKSAFTLAFAGVIVKVIGALYRIPLYSILGSEGMGLYQYAYPVYAIMLTVSSAGLNVAISKAVAERWVLGRRKAASKVFRVSLVLMAVLGFAGFVAMFSMSGWIAANMARDSRAAISIAAISPALFMAAVLSALRGWFQGIEEMSVPAISQVLEQFGRLLTMYSLGVMLLPRGIEYAAAGATFGAVVGAFGGVVYTAIAYFRRTREWDLDNDGTDEPWGSVAREIIFTAIPISLASAVFGITEIIDLGLVPGRLQSTGLSPEEATRLFGQLTGGAFPLLNIPTIFTGALQMALVPSISGAAKLRDRESIVRRIRKALAITVALALPAAMGIYVLADPIPALLFQDWGIGRVLRPLAPGVFFLALQQVTAGILHGLGRMKVPLMNLTWAALTKAILTYVLVGNPSFGVVGASIATSVHFGVAALLNLLAIKREIGDVLDGPAMLKISLSTAIMSVVAGFTYGRMQTSIGWGPATIAAIVAGIIAYGILVFATGAVTFEDLQSLPLIGSLFRNRKKD